MPRYGAKRDSTEPDIVAALEKCGWQVARLNSGELPDLLCRHRSTGKLALLEVESGDYKRYRKKAQKEMLSDWAVPIVRTLDAALLALNT